MPDGLDLWRATVRRLAALRPTTLVFDDQPVDTESRGRRYVIVDPDPAYVTRPRADDRDVEMLRVVARCCGSTREQAMDCTRLVRARMRNWVPWPAMGRVYESDTGPLAEDDSVPTDLRYSVTITFSVDP